MRNFPPRRAGWHRLSAALLLCSVMVPVSATWADDDPESLDIMERQMERIQQQQMELQRDLTMMRKQIAQHRAHAGTGTGTGEHSLQVSGSAGHVRGGWTPHEGRITAMGERTPPGMGAPHIGGHSDNPNGSFLDTPTFESVVAHRDEDLISHMANNNVGPHTRETVGAQSAGALGSKVFHAGAVSIILGGFFDAAA